MHTQQEIQERGAFLPQLGSHWLREFFERIAETGTRGRSPFGHVEKVPASYRPRRIDRSLRGWLPRRNPKQTRRGVGKRPARMSAGLLTNGRKERRDDGRREPHKKRKELWPRYEIANFFPTVHARRFLVLLFNGTNSRVCKRFHRKVYYFSLVDIVALSSPFHEQCLILVPVRECEVSWSGL